MGIEPASTLISRSRLRWLGHVERKDKEDWISRCRDMRVEEKWVRGRGKKKWMECVSGDMKLMGLRVEEAQNRNLWKIGIAGKRQTRKNANMHQIDDKR